MAQRYDRNSHKSKLMKTSCKSKHYVNMLQLAENLSRRHSYENTFKRFSQ